MQRGAPLVAAWLALVGVAALGAHVSPGFAAPPPAFSPATADGPAPFQPQPPHGPQMIDARVNPRLSDGVRADQFPIPSAAPQGSIAALVAFFGIVMMVGIGLVVIVRKLK